LGQSKYVASDNYTIADISAYIFVFIAVNALKVDALETKHNIKRWFDDVSSRPSFKD
jgi:glutathione S-transferase